MTTGRSPAPAEHLAEAAPGVAVLPPLSLVELAATIGECDACVAADTGPARLAAAAGTPTIALFGPSVSARFGLGPPNIDLDAPVPCDERNPLNMTSQSCWWSGRCVQEGLTTCTREIAVEAVLDRLIPLLPVPTPAGRSNR